MKKLLLLIGIQFLFTVSLIAQQCTIPDNISLVEKEDYAPYHELVVECVGWLETTPFNEQQDKRKLVHTFLFKWLSGTPTLRVSMYMYHMEFISADTEKLLIPFLAGWARSIIESDFKISEYRGMAEGVKTVLTISNLPDAPKRNKELKRLAEEKKKGTLVAYLKQKTKD
ncbi:hypothetical protein [Gracilimonas sp.]|uniref:hypothetical protein n=1 Tax=Gracilimonas sp. TaxID=1974203 RepID=UPI003BACA728